MSRWGLHSHRRSMGTHEMGRTTHLDVTSNNTPLKLWSALRPGTRVSMRQRFTLKMAAVRRWSGCEASIDSAAACPTRHKNQSLTFGGVMLTSTRRTNPDAAGPHTFFLDGIPPVLRPRLVVQSPFTLNFHHALDFPMQCPFPLPLSFQICL